MVAGWEVAAGFEASPLAMQGGSLGLGVAATAWAMMGTEGTMAAREEAPVADFSAVVMVVAGTAVAWLVAVVMVVSVEGQEVEDRWAAPWGVLEAAAEVVAMERGPHQC